MVPKRILVAPMDWGLGHATRCVPVVRTLLRKGHTVVLGGEGRHMKVLQDEFSSIETVPLPNYDIRYTSTPFLLNLKFPFLVARVYQRSRMEHARTEEIVKEKSIDAVIADQRFGCYTQSARSICISHQLCVKMPLWFAALERVIANRLRFAAQRYDQLWIPDSPGNTNLTGDLTRKYPLPPNHVFVGPLSRFAGMKSSKAQMCDLLVILSGPEPQRTLFERKIMAQLHRMKREAVVLLGKPGGHISDCTEKICTYSHVDSARLGALLRGARHVVCRGGYSSIMDLVVLGKRAVLVPTPGQTEQEYLCSRLAGAGLFVSRRQSGLNIGEAINALEHVGAPQFSIGSEDLLDRAVSDL